MKTALVLGGSGFIGHHMVRKLQSEGFWVRAVDIKYPEFSEVDADDFLMGDLCDQNVCARAIDRQFDEIYQFAADMGGAGYIFTGENDADIIQNSATINLNVLRACQNRNSKNIFYSSSACIYPQENQEDINNPNCEESSAYPANPDSDYGWEKLISERLYLSYARNKGFRVRIGRYHNIFGEEGAWTGGREKAPAAICRKVAAVPDGGQVEIWGDGLQTRSFLYIDECIQGTLNVMRSNHTSPINIGSDQMVSINELFSTVSAIAEKKLLLRHVEGPQGVRGRNSDNRLIYEATGWRPSMALRAGLEKTYPWIEKQVHLSLTSQ
jgi:nucleoside-diphosphate-sugar epimerase